VAGLRGDIDAWRLEANHDLIGLLEEVVEACSVAPRADDPALLATLRGVVERERASRARLLQRGTELHAAMDRVVLPTTGLERQGPALRVLSRRPPALATHAAAVLLAMTVSACTSIGGISEYAAPPLEDTDGDGLPDGCEQTVFGTDPHQRDSDGNGVADGNEDSDDDGVANGKEQTLAGPYSCPSPDPDTGDTGA
jgi:hypothetical protein